MSEVINFSFDTSNRRDGGKSSEAIPLNLSSQSEIYQSVLDTYAIVAITDRRGRISYVNDMFCKISQYQREELIGHTHQIVNSGYHPREFFIDLWKTISAGLTWEGDIKNRKKNGEFYWVRTVIVPSMDKLGNIDRYFSIRTDITEQKKFELEIKERNQELEDANIELERASRVKDDFLQTASHELRTPLTIIREYANLLNDGLAGTCLPAQQDCVDVILSNCSRLSTLIDNLLDLQKIDADNIKLDLEVVNVLETVKEVVEPFVLRCDARQIVLALDTDVGDETIFCDKGMIIQVLINLIGNAVKFCSTPGKIKVSVQTSGRSVIFSVTDTGPGISLENQEIIFQNFVQLNRKESGGYKGTGLGLSISQKILLLHHARIEIDSEPGNGSTFRFSLPVRTDHICLKLALENIGRNNPGDSVTVSLLIYTIEERPDGLANHQIIQLMRRSLRDTDEIIELEDLRTFVIIAEIQQGHISMVHGRINTRLIRESNGRLKFGTQVVATDLSTMISELDQDPATIMQNMLLGKAATKQKERV